MQDNNEVIDALSALAQTTRLDTFRLLVSREPDGIAAGELARLAVRFPKTRCQRIWPFWRVPVLSVASAKAARSFIAPT